MIKAVRELNVYVFNNLCEHFLLLQHLTEKKGPVKRKHFSLHQSNILFFPSPLDISSLYDKLEAQP